MSKQSNRFFDKSGAEIMYTILVLMIIAALVITICFALSKSFKKTGSSTMNKISNDAIDTINDALSPETEDISGI